MTQVPTSHIEAILFVEAKAITYKKLAQILNSTPEAVAEIVTALSQVYETEQRGLRLLLTDSGVQMTTAPELHEIVAQVIKDERTGDLTKPSLETLSIIAYRSPVTKAEIETIRGVNCSMILRNLLIRGLIEETFDKTKGVEVYDITHEYLQLLGVSQVNQLPDYERLSRDLKIGEVLGEMGNSDDFFQQLEANAQPAESATSVTKDVN